jgi:PPOX class probable F420-dependent enzyme
MATLNDDAKELLRRPIYAWATTLYPDGAPHNTVIWVDVDGDDVIFNTAVGRAKERHLRRDPRVAVSVLDPDDGFHLVSVTGTAELDEASGDAVIDALAKKYLGVDSYPYRTASEKRVTVRVTPQRVVYSPGGGG